MMVVIDKDTPLNVGNVFSLAWTDIPAGNLRTVLLGGFTKSKTNDFGPSFARIFSRSTPVMEFRTLVMRSVVSVMLGAGVIENGRHATAAVSSRVRMVITNMAILPSNS